MARKDRTPTTPILTRLRRWLILLAALLLLWLGGAIAYVERVEQQAVPNDERTDAIVMLTGGAARMGAALRLLNDNKAERLLVSGVAQTATRQSLMQAVLPTMPDAAQASNNWQGIDLQLLFECCIDLGFEASDTAGNAAEAASWATTRGYKSIRLVTANYHMPRALVEFGRLPGIVIVPHPVRSDAMRVEDWWQRRTATFFLLGEYSKYVAALLRAHLGSQLAATVEEKKAAAPAAEPAPAAPDAPARTDPPQADAPKTDAPKAESAQ